ncbi:siderophore-interacting protein [Microbacterium telephonicum]|uniref:NADPH-dependent ferric siderophore reductase n=1 Tax=Microbacterium telephonicum TaxID=1714841 RepID=A0A498CCM6_9MICO|nr:siderophore-interacting protein [Microbacterium telephonicum]RLK52779.1 NADPH-dependent ferric siderophore reductase [Microbacterium telephonicum]
MNQVKSAPSHTPSFRLERRGLDLRFRTVHLAARQWLTPDYVRVRLVGADLVGFDSPGCDDHIRIFFPDTVPGTVEELRAAPSREYTPLAWDPAEGWLDLEFAVHGADGVAAPWAATADLGSLAGIGGPRGSMVVSGRPGAWFLAGDETAVPAMRRFTHLMDADAVGRILIEVDDAAHELPIETPPGVTVTHLHRGAAASGSTLAAALDGLGAADFPGGDVFGFVAAEQGIVKPGRALLLERWGLPAEQVVVKGYWKRGEAEYHAPH